MLHFFVSKANKKIGATSSTPVASLPSAPDSKPYCSYCIACKGEASAGQIGIQTTNHLAEDAYFASEVVTDIACGGNSTWFLTSKGKVYATGENVNVVFNTTYIVGPIWS